MVKVMIADDHALIRRIVREVVEKESDLELIAEARDGNEAEEQATHTQPDVILMDLNMPGCNGFEATERVLACSPHSRVVIFTASSKEQYALHALQLGAIGYITKDIEPDGLVNAIRSAARNEICIPRSLSSQVLAHLRSLRNISNHASSLTQEDAAEAPAIATTGTAPINYKIPQRPTTQSLDATGQGRPLTGREYEILNLMRKGRKNREIAQELAIAESTVHKHIQNIFEKLHARNRIEAIYLTRLA
ncbi:MAG TPA: response regulator transcription factor [Ktedonobacteraceae bacterium]|nr:response regulator transcription factor [Ktedonobacteraceae bacterium]